MKEVKKMKKFTLYVGLNDKDTKIQKISTLDAYKMVENVITKKTDGYTISEAQGYYKHEDGTLTIENTLRIEMLFVNKELVKEFVGTLKIMLNQESIAVEETTVTSELM